MGNRVDLLGWTAVILCLVVSVTPPIAGNEPSTPGKYTLKERRALDKLRSLVEPELYKSLMRRDEYLIRWLQESDFDVEKATEKLLASLKWRKEHKIDATVQENLLDLVKLCPYSLEGRDKSGRPIITFNLGACPVRKIILSGRGDKVRRYVYSAFEKTIETIGKFQSEGKSISDAVLILDLNGFSWREHACLQCIPIELEIITAYEVHYPRYFQAVFVINAPRVFENLLAIIWPILSEHSRKIVHIHGFDKTEWQGALLKNISPDQLEPPFGGTKRVKKFATQTEG